MHHLSFISEKLFSKLVYPSNGSCFFFFFFFFFFFLLSQNPKHLNYLTSEQALADFAVLIKYLKQAIEGAANSSVVAIGGSYGGMLSAWMRIKYPNIVVG